MTELNESRRPCAAEKELSLRGSAATTQSPDGLVTPGQPPAPLHIIAIPPIVATLALNEYGLYEDSNGKGCKKSLRSIDR